MKGSDHPGGDITDMASFACLKIIAMMKGHAWDSKQNPALTRIFIEAGEKDDK